MVHSIINYKDLGFKTAMSKACRYRVEQKENKELLLKWLADESPENYINGLDYFNIGFIQYIKEG